MAITGQRGGDPAETAVFQAMEPGSDLRIIHYDHFDGIDRPQWDDLWQRTPDATVFQTYDWYTLWVKHFAPTEPLHLLLAYRGGRLVGACPLCIRTQSRYQVFRRRILTFISSFSSAYPLDQGPLVDPREEPAVIDSMARAILRLRGFAAVVFELFTRNSPAERLLRRLEALTGQPSQTTVEATGHLIPLPPTHEEFLTSIGRHTRHNIRVAQRRFFTGEPGRELILARDPAELDELLTIMREQKRQRFRAKGARSNLDEQAFYAFLRELSPILLRQGRLMLQVGRAEGKVAAMLMSFHDEHGHFYSYNSSFDPDYKDLRLSYLLESERVREAIDRGFRAIDLATGHDEHKSHWSQGNMRPLWLGQMVLHPWANLSFQLYEVLKRGIRAFRRGLAGELHASSAPKAQPAHPSHWPSS